MKLDFDPGFDITPLSVDEGFRLGADCFDKARSSASSTASARAFATRIAMGRKTSMPS